MTYFDIEDATCRVVPTEGLYEGDMVLLTGNEGVINNVWRVVEITRTHDVEIPAFYPQLIDRFGNLIYPSWNGDELVIQVDDNEEIRRAFVETST